MGKHLISPIAVGVVLSLGFLMAAALTVGIDHRPLLSGIDYAPSHADLRAADTPVAEVRIRADLTQLSKITSRVRTYTVENGMDRVPAVARVLGMKVALGIWLSNDHVRNEREIETAIRLIHDNKGTIDRVFVGNETLLRQDLNIAELRAYLQRVKQSVANQQVEVTTAETWGFWLKYPELALDCDVIGANLLPYWDGVSIADAVPDAVRRMATLQETFPNKRIVISEIGWPSQGQTWEAAIPSPAAQQQFLAALLANAILSRSDYFVLEAFDQPWKVRVEGEIGSGWGLYGSNGRPKIDLAKLKSASRGTS